MYAATPFWAFFEEESHSFLEDFLFTLIDKTDSQSFCREKLLEKYSEDNKAMGTEHWRLCLRKDLALVLSLDLNGL